MPEHVRLAEGRQLFGINPERYDATRPDYPSWIFEELRDSGALSRGAATLEIGPGSGRATRRLVEYGADPLVLIEPDIRFMKMLETMTRHVQTRRILHASFEEADVVDAEFDLAVAATMFHWIDPETRTEKLRRIVRNGGTAALIWNVLGDLDKSDAFHDATQDLLSSLAVTPSRPPNAIPFALDREAREAEARLGGFHEVAYSESRWSYQLDTQGVRNLYESFSPIQRLESDSRNRILDELARIADQQFDGVVERNVTSCLYRLR
jgi:SAM-dependent methyltransferase